MCIKNLRNVFLEPPQISCNVESDQHSGVDILHCDITKIHFTEKQYTCTWFQIKKVLIGPFLF